MKIRLNKLFSDAGLGSRREVEEYIRQGRVMLNGRRATLSDTVGAEDSLLLDGVDLPVRELVADSIAEAKLAQREQAKAEKATSRSSRRDERAESQRIAAQNKSAALRSTSKNNPENKRRYRQRLAEAQGETTPEVERSSTRGQRGGKRTEPHKTKK